MRKATIVFGSMLAMAAGPLLITATALVPTAAYAQQKVSVNVGKPLSAAQAAIQKQQWQPALNEIKKAQAVTPRTAYDDYKINELLWYVYLRQGRNAEAAKLLEQQMNSPLMPASEKTSRTKTLAQLYFRAGSYGKALQLGNQYLKAVPGDREIQVLNAQAYFEQRDYKNAIALAERIAKTQNPPSQDMLQLIARSNYELKDSAALSKSLEQLLRYYPSADTWKSVLKGYIDSTKNDEQLGALYRLAQDVNAMRPSDYVDMAQALAVTGYAMEAQRVLEGAVTAKVFSETELGGVNRTLESVKRSADKERAALPGAAKAVAAANTSADDLYHAGKLYFSSGDYAKAIAALQKAVAKGGLAKPDDAQALLGIALSRAGRKADASKAFDAVKGPEYAGITKLWKLAAR